MDILYLTHLLSPLIIFALAIGLGVFLTRKFGLNWRLYWIGAATFVLSQIGHVPFNLAINVLFRRGILPSPPAAWQLPFSALWLGLSAGLFEEGARYIVYRWWAKDARWWGKGLLFGAGHGGAEALILGVLLLITYVFMVAYRGADLMKLVPAEQLSLAQQQINLYWSVSWYDSLISALERLFALPIQVVLAVLVLQTFTRHQIRWLFLAIGWHALVDAVAVYAVQTWSVYTTEGLVGVMAVISLAMILALRSPEPASPQPQTAYPAAPMPPSAILPMEETAENLDKTRFL